MNKSKFRKFKKRLFNLPKGKNFILYLLNRIKIQYLKHTNKSKVAFPTTIMIELTNKCNLKCITCPREYKFGKQMDIGQMSFNQFKMIIDQTHPYLDSIGLTGLGEPLLFNNLIDCIDYIRKINKGIIISISTNLSLNNISILMKQLINKIDTIQISMDGLNDIYNKIRVNADFKLFSKNLKNLINLSNNSKTDIILNAVIIEDNYKQMIDMVDFAQQYSIKHINFTPINLVSIPDSDYFSMNFYKSIPFKNELNDTIIHSKRFPELSVSYANFDKINKFEICHYIWNYFYITWDGYIVPCCAKPFPKELNFGNIFKLPFIDILNSEKYIQFRKIWLSGKVPEFCQKC